jgi:peptide deformylase
MAILKVALMGHPVLRQKATPVPTHAIASPGVQQLIDDMFETMHEYAGIGLAGPQVHEPVRIFVAGTRETADIPTAISDDHEMPLVALINPEVTPVGSETTEGWEGCLSIPDIRGRVPRAFDVRVRAFDRRGKRIEFTASGLAARVIQHETDHLDGVLFFDRMRSFESLTYMEEYRRYWVKSDDDEDGDDEAGAERAEAPSKVKSARKAEPVRQGRE